jgi:hypothetical protein
LLLSCVEELLGKAGIEGTSAYHRVLKHNLPRINSGLLTINNLITPGGINLSITRINKEERNLIVNLGINELISDMIKPDLCFYSIIFFSSPVDNALSPYELISFQNKINPPNQIDIITLTIDIPEKDFPLFEKYSSVIQFSAVVAEANSIVARWTSTIVTQM